MFDEAFLSKIRQHQAEYPYEDEEQKLENYLNIHGSIFSRLYQWVTREAPDRDDSMVSWIIRFLLVAGPFHRIRVKCIAGDPCNEKQSQAGFDSHH